MNEIDDETARLIENKKTTTSACRKCLKPTVVKQVSGMNGPIFTMEICEPCDLVYSMMIESKADFAVYELSKGFFGADDPVFQSAFPETYLNTQ